MKKQLTHISVHQSSKVLSATAAAIFSAFFIIPFAVYALVQGDFVSGLISLFILPFFYWLVFYIFQALGFWFYNLIASQVGGVEFELIDVEKELLAEKPQEPS